MQRMLVPPAPPLPGYAQPGELALRKLVRLPEPKRIEGLTFADAEGRPKSLADWRGRVVAINLWATWCVPCRLELPSLDRLQAKLGGADFAVVAISLDRTGAEAPKKFLQDNKLSHLELFLDPKGESASKLTARGLPMTLLIDREGREVARLAGVAEWDGPALTGVIEAMIRAK